MRARVRGSLAVRRACSASRRPCGLRAKAATRLTSDCGTPGLCPDRDAPNVWGTSLLGQLDVDRVAGERVEARGAQLGRADHALDVAPVDRHVGGASRFVS